MLNKGSDITLQSILSFIVKPLDADVFININTLNSECSDIIESMQPKSVIIKEYNIQFHSNNTYSKNFLNMVHRMCDCNDDRISYENKHDIKYDVVIRIRPDFLCKNEIHPKYLSLASDTKNTIFMVEHKTLPIYSRLGVIDTFFFASSHAMDRLLGIVRTTNFYSIKYCKLNEYMLYWVIKQNNFQIQFIYMDGLLIKYTLPSMNIKSQFNVIKEGIPKIDGISNKEICNFMNREF